MYEERRKLADVAIEKGLKHDKIKDWINKHFRLLGCEQLTDNDPLSMKFRTIVSKLREEVQTMVCFRCKFRNLDLKSSSIESIQQLGSGLKSCWRKFRLRMKGIGRLKLMKWTRVLKLKTITFQRAGIWSRREFQKSPDSKLSLIL